MAGVSSFRQYTKCYAHTPGDVPFRKTDLLSFVAGNAWPGGVVMLLSFLSGASVIGYIALAAQYAATITAVADKWLYHRLVCIPTSPAPVCAVGTAVANPEDSPFGDFDNDDTFSVRLMPHPPRAAGLSDDQQRDYAKDVEADGFQGQALLAPVAWDLPYEDLTGSERAFLHVEAEGNFWQAMKDYALLLGIGVGVGAAAGAAAGAAIGCAIGGLFGPIGCAVGAFFGALAGGAAGAGAGAYVGAQVAFHSDPGNVEDANVGDHALGPIRGGDRVVVCGTHVYDGFHEGWHEFHPLMIVMKMPDADYLEANPALPAGAPVPDGLTEDDVRHGVHSPAFLARAVALRDRWCREIRVTLDPGLHALQAAPENRWTVHPDVDGCTPGAPTPPPLH